MLLITFKWQKTQQELSKFSWEKKITANSNFKEIVETKIKMRLNYELCLFNIPFTHLFNIYLLSVKRCDKGIRRRLSPTTGLRSSQCSGMGWGCLDIMQSPHQTDIEIENICFGVIHIWIWIATAVHTSWRKLSNYFALQFTYKWR